MKYALAEGVTKFVFDRALLNRYSVSPHAFMRKSFLGVTAVPEFVVVGDQGAQHYNLFGEHDKPLAVWPSWNASTEDIEVLEYLAWNPPGEDAAACRDEAVTPALRPVFGQENRIFITGLKVDKDPVARRQAIELLQLCHLAGAKVHLHGQATFSLMFGMPWDSVDWMPDNASKWGLTLPNGVHLSPSDKKNWTNFSDWIEVVGMTMADVDDKYDRTRFHIRALRWAAENYTDETRIKRRFTPTVDDARNLERHKWKNRVKTQSNNWRRTSTLVTRILPMFDSGDGDKAICNSCVLRVSCPLARVDMVCALEGTEMGELAKSFGTRNADSIIDGLNKLLAMQADRLEAAVERERQEDEQDPEVRKSMDSVFKNAAALAKLIDPKLVGKGTTVNNQSLTINGATLPSDDPRQQVAAIVKALNEAGIPREEITGEMIKTMLHNANANANSRPALEGVVVQNTSKKE
jgi:hypothetical protein